MKLFMAAVILVLGSVVGLAAFISIDPHSTRGRTLATTVLTPPDAAKPVSDSSAGQRVTARLPANATGAAATGMANQSQDLPTTTTRGLSQAEALALARRQVAARRAAGETAGAQSGATPANSQSSANASNRAPGIVVTTTPGQIPAPLQPRIVRQSIQGAANTGQQGALTPGVSGGVLNGITVTVPPAD